mmetsp:Transcript_37118/g.74164  ORF Transcript_37118/g.74164 Transcript_37118/m.74164 type:complete len:284 (-) Transcript_37118:666-1517(-)
MAQAIAWRFEWLNGEPWLVISIARRHLPKSRWGATALIRTHEHDPVHLHAIHALHAFPASRGHEVTTVGGRLESKLAFRKHAQLELFMCAHPPRVGELVLTLRDRRGREAVMICRLERHHDGTRRVHHGRRSHCIRERSLALKRGGACCSTPLHRTCRRLPHLLGPELMQKSDPLRRLQRAAALTERSDQEDGKLGRASWGGGPALHDGGARTSGLGRKDLGELVALVSASVLGELLDHSETSLGITSAHDELVAIHTGRPMVVNTRPKRFKDGGCHAEQLIT